MASTTSNYISKIQQDYPIAGEDNDSQGFRNNFKNIASALTSAQNDISSLELSSVKLTSNNDFNNNIIKQAVLQDCATYVFDSTTVTESGNIVLDYSNGSYQKVKVGAGENRFSVINWPLIQKSGSMILSVETAMVQGAYVNFGAGNLVNLGPDIFPLELSSTATQFFQIWNDGTDGNLYVKGLGGASGPTVAELIAAAQTNIAAVTSLTLGGTNVYTTGTNTSTQFATVVTANNQTGNVALLPNQVTMVVADAPILDLISDTVSTTFPVISTANLKVGATAGFGNTTTRYTVTSFTPTLITVSPAFQVGSFAVGDGILFTNPEFTSQPAVITRRKTQPNAKTSAAGGLEGQLYVSSSSIYISHTDTGYTATNWTLVSGDNVTRVTQPSADISTKLATTEFVHNIMPYGMIIMWSGAVTAVPAGWALCDGGSGTITSPAGVVTPYVTPNLVDRFIVGAGGIYAAGTTGGSTDAIVAAHTHVATNVLTDPGHQHYVGSNDSSANDAPYANQEFVRQWDTGLGPKTYTNITSTGITLTTAVASAGVSPVDANLPPYYALCYIMKITGAVLVLVSGTSVLSKVGGTYSQANTASGGYGTYTYSYTGDLPIGTVLNTATGVVSGTPIIPQNFSYVIVVQDSSTPIKMQATSAAITGTIAE